VSCFCQDVGQKARVCVACQEEYHPACLGERGCPSCLVANLDPLFQRTAVKARLYLQPSRQYKTPVKALTTFSCQPGERLEIRCIRLKDTVLAHHWPDFCYLTVNDRPLKRMEPLSSNSALKKRKDSQIDFELFAEGIRTTNLLELVLGNDRFRRENHRIEEQPSPYYMQVIVVQKPNLDSFINQVRAQSKQPE
jgi:hypothetical protein